MPPPLVPALLGASVAQAALEEIVVTAQKKSENLQEVPISITAVTADGLDKAGIVGDEEFGCFGLMSPDLVDTLGVVFEESSVGDESDEFELCSSAEDEDQCGELASAGSPCYWDFEEETCNSYE